MSNLAKTGDAGANVVGGTGDIPCGNASDEKSIMYHKVESSSNPYPETPDNVYAGDDSGWTPFLRACRHGQTHIIGELLSNGADPYVCDSLGWNAVPLAVASGKLETLKEVLKAAKWKRKDLAAALCLAALNGNCDAVHILFSSHASPNISINDSEITPLMLAAGEGHIEMVSLLLEHNADPDMTNALHQTALDAAVIRDQIAIQNILGPVTHLRSKISSHIPLPISPPNKALQSPSTIQPEIRFLGASPFTGRYQDHSPGFGSSPMLHCAQIYNPVCSPFYLPSGNYLAGGGAFQNKGYLSPLPASYPSLVPPFHFSPSSSPRHNQCSGPSNNMTGCCQNISDKTDGGGTEKSITKGNKRLRKWWCGMKRRYVGEQLGRNEEFLDNNENVDVTMEKRLENFLRSIKMSEYYSLFTAQEVDFSTFLTLTGEDLEAIGVKNSAHRSKIAEKIRKFSMHASNF